VVSPDIYEAVIRILGMKLAQAEIDKAFAEARLAALPPPSQLADNPGGTVVP
jgi:hypothetical protein